MRKYVPNLIPEEKRVLADYFQSSPTKSSQEKGKTSFFNIVTRILFGLIAFVILAVFARHPGFGLSLGTLTIFLFPPFRKWLENRLRFQFTTNLLIGTVSFLTSVALFNGLQFRRLMLQEQQNQKVALLKEQKRKQELVRQNKVRLDSIHYYISKADKLLQTKSYLKAISVYQKGKVLLKSDNPSDLVRISASLAQAYYQTQQYKQALSAYDELMTYGTVTGERLYKRALCYQRTGSEPEAVRDLHQASELGYSPAKQLYNKLNPLIKRLLYYQTVCCDGSYSPSNAKGRGACSHHGGVCDWNKPIYETYRKYDYNGL